MFTKYQFNKVLPCIRVEATLLSHLILFFIVDKRNKVFKKNKQNCEMILSFFLCYFPIRFIILCLVIFVIFFISF